MSPHWKHTATRCAVEGCERTRRKGWTTCAIIGHAERGVSLYGLAPKAAKLLPIELSTCRWFAACENPATHEREHPVLGRVPICDRCADVIS